VVIVFVPFQVRIVGLPRSKWRKTLHGGYKMGAHKRLTKLRVPGFNTTHFSSYLRHFVPSTLPQLQNPSDSTFLFSTSSSSGVGLNISPASDKLRAAGTFD